MDDQPARKAADMLSFWPKGHFIRREDLPAEFVQMLAALKTFPGPDVLRRVGTASGSHLLKLVSPRADGSGGKPVVLRSAKTEGNVPRRLLPSLNAPDIPAAKLVYRPLEVVDALPRGLIAHMRDPDPLSPDVISAFAHAYGHCWLEACAAAPDDLAEKMRAEMVAACSDLAAHIHDTASDALVQKVGRVAVDVLQAALTEELPPIRELPAREFPIIFLPRPGGGDVQVTPLSPAGALGDMDEVRNHHFMQKADTGPMFSRGNWVRQHISAKPQNISGAIRNSRNRFSARLPPVLRQSHAELHRFIHGGRFPRWRQPEVDVWLWRYGDMLARSQEQTTIRALRLACDRMADRLIADAMDFAEETLAAAQDYAAGLGRSDDGLQAPPPVEIIGNWSGWNRQDDMRRTQILTSVHFRHRLARQAGRKGG